MVEGSLDIESMPKREIRKYTVKRGSVYTQTRQYDKKGNLEKEIWERKSGGKVILDNAAYISKEKCKKLEEFISKKFSPSDIIRIVKRENYEEIGGFIVWSYQERLYLSSEVTKVEPPFEEEFSITA